MKKERVLMRKEVLIDYDGKANVSVGRENDTS